MAAFPEKGYTYWDFESRCTSIHDFFHFFLLKTVMRTDAANSEKRDGSAAIRARHTGRAHTSHGVWTHAQSIQRSFLSTSICDSRSEAQCALRSEASWSIMLMRQSRRRRKEHARPADGTDHTHTHACATLPCSTCLVLAIAVGRPLAPTVIG